MHTCICRAPTPSFDGYSSLHVGEAVVDINGAVAEVFVFNADIGAAVEVILRAIPDAELARCHIFCSNKHPCVTVA